MNAGYYGLAVIGVIATAIALFFYARVVYCMYMQEPESALTSLEAGSNSRLVLLVTAVGTTLPGVYPAPFVEWAVKAVKPFFM